jgi:predicted acyltransferase
MFIVGVSIPFSVANRLKRGDSESSITRHAIQRALLLLLFGWMIGCIGSGRIAFKFQNVLAQLSVTYLLAFLIRNKNVYFQVIFTILILLLVDIAYRVFPVDGFNQPFVPDHNMGSWFDMKISGELSPGHWVNINAIPTAAHTIWGVLFGKLLMSEKTASEKIKIMVIAGVSALIIGFSLDFLGITPIIKRIATASFVFASGGWAFLALCLSYWLIDVRNYVKGTKMFIIVGMNSLFIYLFAQAGGSGLISRIISPFVKTIFAMNSQLIAGIVLGILVWASMWYICYWLYTRKIFIRI